MKASQRFFTNRACAHFPCHQGIDPAQFNCLFCYCPLYFFADCGGEYTILGNGFKNCTQCTIPHRPEGYEHILMQLKKGFQAGLVPLGKPRK